LGILHGGELMDRPKLLPISQDRIQRLPASRIGQNLKVAFGSPVAPSLELDALIDLINLIP
jgi:hypothetical protein